MLTNLVIIIKWNPIRSYPILLLSLIWSELKEGWSGCRDKVAEISVSWDTRLLGIHHKIESGGTLSLIVSLHAASLCTHAINDLSSGHNIRSFCQHLMDWKKILHGSGPTVDWGPTKVWVCRWLSVICMLCVSSLFSLPKLSRFCAQVESNRDKISVIHKRWTSSVIG